MEPRLIIKTHTGALRPGNYSLLISKCTYPNKSEYPEVIIKKLQNWIKEKSIAKFTIILSTEKNRGFGFLQDNMIWSWRGHVINTLLTYLGKKDNNDPSVFYDLTLIEKICYLRFFLEKEGAIILKIAEKINEGDKLTYLYLKNNIQNLFREIFEEYLSLPLDFRSRIKIKELYTKIKTKEKYDEATLTHKIKPHIQAFADLGLLKILNEGEKNEEYQPETYNNKSTFFIILDRLKSIEIMENLFSRDYYYPLINEIYNLSAEPYSYELHSDLVKKAISYGYQVMRDNFTGMADINALFEWCCIKMLAEDKILVHRKDIEDYLNIVKKEHPTKIRYHVDGKGRIAYLIFSEPL